MTPNPKLTAEELREKLAAIEHERWAAWQIWCNRVIRDNYSDIGKLEAVLKGWDRQIDLPYQLLSDKEKASDMEQVDRYWPLIEEYIAQATETAAVGARLDELMTIFKIIVSDPTEFSPLHWSMEITYPSPSELKERIAALKGKQE